jgi:PPOX class probable F420-dependent enzyme
MAPGAGLALGMEAMAVSSGVGEVPPEPVQVIPRSLADLVERPLHAHLATVRPDGTPQVNPTWFRFDGEYLWLTTTNRRQKNRNWQVQPAVALSIADPDRPSRYLEIRGRVERIVPDPGGAEFVRLAERYGMPQGPPPDAADRIAVAIRPRYTTTQ